MLRGPHLVLTHLGGDVCVAIPGQLIKPLHRVLRLDDLLGIAEAERVARPPTLDRAPPFGKRGGLRLMRASAPYPDHIFQHMRAIAHDPEIDFDVLVDRGWINIDVDLPRLRREGVKASCNAIVKARADAEDR